MKTLNSLKTSVLLAVLFLLPGLAGAQEVSKVLETQPFTGIDVNSVFKVELIKGDSHFVEVTTDQKHLDNVQSSVRDGILKLDLRGNVRNATASVTIITPELNHVSLSGAVSLKSEGQFEAPAMTIELSGATNAQLDVNTQELRTRLSGASNLTLTGFARDHRSSASGASQVRAMNLVTETANVNASGAANIRVNVSESIVADASGTSRIAFENEPKNKSIKTSGVASVNDIKGNSGTNISGTIDTTRINFGSRELIIVEDDGKVKASARRRRSFRNNWSGFEMGINGYMAPDYKISLPVESRPIDLRYERSFVYNLNLFQQNVKLIGDNFAMVTGVGFTFNNYRFDNQTRWVQDDQEVTFVRDDVNKIVQNKLNLTYLNVPLMLEYQTSGRKEVEKFHIAAGVIGGARIATNVRYRYDDNGRRRSEKDHKDFHIHPFKLDLTARIGWGRVNLFATYSLNSMFKEDRGPELYPFSVGLRLVSF